MAAHVTLRPGHVQPVWAGHPWVFAQAVAGGLDALEPGQEVRVLDAQGRFLGRGLCSPKSALAVRIYTREDRPIDAALFAERVELALQRRHLLGLPSAHTNGYRLIHAEGDGLPGLVVDRFGEVLVVQCATVGLQQRRQQICELLQDKLRPLAIFDRTSTQAGRLEGFNAAPGLVSGADVTELRFKELGFEYRVPIGIGQKTGYYFDQRPLRQRVEALSEGRRVLDSYCFVGSQALCAARGGAREVLAVDTSREAIDVATTLKQALLPDAPLTFERADAVQVLERAAQQGGYDLVLCDPPKLARSSKGRKGALGAMRGLLGKALLATRRGGLSIVSSCSAAIGEAELTRAAALAAGDVAREVSVLERVSQGPDHPVPAAFPEGLYLSTLILHVR